MKKLLTIVCIVAICGCIFSVERKGFDEDDLTVPLPYYIKYEEKPQATAFLPPPYDYKMTWEIVKLYAGYKGIFRITVENTGKSKLFIYGFSIKINGEEQRDERSRGKEIQSGEKETFMFSFDCPSIGNYTYDFGVYLMANLKGWYDYGLKYVGGGELRIENFISSSPSYHKNYYFYFDKMNKLVNPYDSIIYQKAVQISSKYGDEYNIAKVCAIFDYVYENVEYINDTDDEWTQPSIALVKGGDCEEFAMLIAAMVTSIGGTARIYITDNHAFSAIYIGRDLKLLDCIDSYYQANLSYALFEDEFGYWLVADPLGNFYLGGLPAGGVVEGGGGRIYKWSIMTNDIYSIDILKD